jgi:hypothetical protein
MLTKELPGDGVFTTRAEPSHVAFSTMVLSQHFPTRLMLAVNPA